MTRQIAVLIVGLLPASRLKNRLLALVGGRHWSVARTARIHPNVLWQVHRLRLGERARIGPGNIFRDIRSVGLDDEADIGQFNWFSAAGGHAHADQQDRSLQASLVMERGAVVTSRHYLDCSGGVRLGVLSALGGVRSTVLSHYADPREWRMIGAPVVIGDSTIVLSNVVITAGTTIVERAMVAAGSVVSKDLTEPEKLYAGVPARAVRDMADAAYLSRTTVRITPRERLHSPPERA